MIGQPLCVKLAGKKTEPIEITSTELEEKGPGVIRIAVFGFCCQDSTIIMSPGELYDKASGDSKAKWVVPVVVVLSLVAVGVFLTWSFVVYRKKEAQRRSTGEAHPESVQIQ